MTSTVVSDHKSQHSDRSPLSLSLDTRPSSSPFPSPSSSFIPPPMPEFVVKLPPPGRHVKRGSASQHPLRRDSSASLSQPSHSENNDEKGSPSTTQPDVSQMSKTDSISAADQDMPSSSPLPSAETSRFSNPQGQETEQTGSAPNGEKVPDDFISPPLASPSSSHHAVESNTNNHLLPPIASSPSSSTTTPTMSSSALPAAEPLAMTSNSSAPPKMTNLDLNNNNNNNHESHLLVPPTQVSDPSTTPPPLSSSRPAPPSPAVSRRTSAAFSISSARSKSSKSSRPSSMAISRSNSMRKSSSGAGSGTTSTNNSAASPLLNGKRLSQLGAVNATMTPMAPPQRPYSPVFTNPSTSAGGLSPSARTSEESSSLSTTLSTSPTSTKTMPPPIAKSSSGASTVVSDTTGLKATSDDVTSGAQSRPHGSEAQMVTVQYIKIRDFAFGSEDDRHKGLGPDVPKANHFGRLNKYLGRWIRMGGEVEEDEQMSSSEEEDERMEEEDDDGWSGFNFGQGRLSWNMGGGGGAGYGYAGLGATAAALAAASNSGSGAGENGFPSRKELDRNFMDDEEEGEYDDDEEGGLNEHVEDEGNSRSEDPEEEEPLYPGLYKALYQFIPEGTAEMGLEEEQIVKVVGRGGGVGWAVVIKNWDVDKGCVAGKGEVQHALVPESYLEPHVLD